MVFDISRVLDSSMAVLDHNASGSSNQSQIHINAKHAKQAIRSVISEFANQLFDDAQFLTANGLEVLFNFQKLKVKKSDFETTLKDQLLTAAFFCHSRHFTASDEGRPLNAEENLEITQALQHLAMVHQESEDANGLAGKLAILAEATPVIVKISEVYANYIRPIDYQLRKLLGGQGVAQNVIASIESYRSDLFPGTSCSKKGLQAIKEAAKAPNFSLMKYEDCLPAASNYILHLALAAQSEERGMTDSDVEAIKAVIKGLRSKMGVLRQAKINHESLVTSIKTHEQAIKQTMKQVAELAVKLETRTLADSKKIEKPKKKLSDYNYYTTYVKDFKDLNSAVQKGYDKRAKVVDEAKVSLVKYTKSCVVKQIELEHFKKVQEWGIEEKKQAWSKFTNEKFASAELIQDDVQVFDNKYFTIGLLMENPEAVAQSALHFIGHLTSRVSRQSEE